MTRSAIVKDAVQELSAADYATLAEFREALRRFLVFSEAAARKAGLSPQQHQALLAIKGRASAAPATVGDLARSLAIRPHSAVGLVNRLVRAGYVTRNAHASDRRRVTLALTQSGEAILARLSAAHGEEIRLLTPPLKALITRLER